jgi:hypothetical protein
MTILEDYLILLEYDRIIEDYSFVDYEMYCNALELVMSNKLSEEFFLENITEGFWDQVKRVRLSRELVRVFSELKSSLNSIAKEFKVNTKTIIASFTQRDIFGVLKAFAFNLRLILRAFNELTAFIRKGLFEIFREIFRLKMFEKVRKGAMKVDEIMNRYPLLKKVTGIVLAGLILYMWLHMTFIGDLDYDFNFETIVLALKGTFSIADLFVSPEGLMLVTLFGVGTVFGLSVPWLGKSLYNLGLALFYTAYAKLKQLWGSPEHKQVMEKLKRKIPKVRLTRR